MTKYLLIILLLLFSSCKTNKDTSSEESDKYTLASLPKQLTIVNNELSKHLP